MSVSAILESKGNNVITAKPSATIQDIAETLATNKIGAVIIVDDNEKVCGIASERDVVREVAKIGPKSLGQAISVCMTKSVVFCEDSDTIDLVMEKMTKGRFRHVPVITNGELQGIISIGDVVKARIEQVERDSEDMKRYIAG